MEIKNIDLDQIKPYEKNPRKNDASVKYVKNSIEQFGFKVPIILDKENTIVCGHTRYKAAQELKLKTVPCIYADDLTDEQIKAFRLADNKVGEFSEWDFEALSGELEGITELDMSAFGFMAEAAELEEVKEDDFEPDLPEEPKSKLGDIYQLGEHRLMCGDSTDFKAFEKLVGGAKVKLALTDPPYGINIVGKDGKVGAGNIAKNQVYNPIIGDNTTEAAKASFEILRNLTEKQILFGGNYFINFLPFSDGWIIWDKRVDMSSNNFADGEMAWCSFHTPVRIYHQLWNGMIREGESEKRVHPTQKPIRMLAEIIRDFSDEADSVIDCFGGSGSTLIACEQIGRKCYMMELSPAYVDVIIERWENFTGQKAILLSE